jgi:holliday junction DNA helicase RuvA
VQALTRIPGLGTKTAQKMILQLKGHLVLDDAVATGNAGGTGTPLEELLTALTEMGFDRTATRTVLNRLREELAGPDEPLTDRHEQEIFRRAIVELSNG